VNRLLPLAILLFAWSARPSAQLIGSCSPLAARSPQNVKELRGVVVDENLAVVPKVRVQLQIRKGRYFRDLDVAETDLNGQFSFENKGRSQYRLVFTPLVGLCPATIPVTYSKEGFKGLRLKLPVAATGTCPQYCETRLKVEEMTGREGREWGTL